MSEYRRRPVKAPRLAGRGLRIAAALMQTPLIGDLLARKSFADLGLPRLLQSAAGEGNPLQPHWLAAEDSGHRSDGSQLAPLAGPRSSEDYRRLYRDGETSPVAVAEAVLEACAAAEGEGPALRAIIAQAPDDLRAQAEASSERWRRGEPIGPLDGVPIAVKDEVDMVPYGTTVGTGFLGRQPAQEDAAAVAALRRAGALLIGKANMHELGIGVTGINPHHGAARNPYAPDHATGGSSSGSAAAVAAGLCPIALGADGGGSIRIPAALCGVYGLKPSFGRISEHGAAPLCWSVAHLGPIAQDPADLGLALALMAGADERDPMSLGRPSCDLREASTDEVSGLRIGIDQAYFDDAEAAVLGPCRRGLDALVEAGAVLVPIRLPDPELTRLAHMVSIVTEMIAGQGPQLLDNMPRYGADVRLNFALGQRLTGRHYVHAQRVRHQVAQRCAELFQTVDLIATPSTARSAPPIQKGAEICGESDLVTLDQIMRFATLANSTGLPAISCPVGYDGPLPIGLQLMARPYAEGLLIRVARRLHRHHDWRRPQRWHSPI